MLFGLCSSRVVFWSFKQDSGENCRIQRFLLKIAEFMIQKKTHQSWCLCWLNICSQREEMAADLCIAALQIFQTRRCFVIPASLSWYNSRMISVSLHLFTVFFHAFLLLNQEEAFLQRLGEIVTHFIIFITIPWIMYTMILHKCKVYMHHVLSNVCKHPVLIFQFSWKSQVLDIIT